MGGRPQSLQRLLADAEQERARTLARLAELDHEIQTFRQALQNLGLQRGPKFDTIDGVTVRTTGPGRTGRPLKYLHPFTLWLKSRPAPLPNSITTWAEAHGLERHQAQSWVLEGDNKRSIPLEWAKVIEEESRDPETGISAVPLSAWGDRIR